MSRVFTMIMLALGMPGTKPFNCSATRFSGNGVCVTVKQKSMVIRTSRVLTTRFLAYTDQIKVRTHAGACNQYAHCVSLVRGACIIDAATESCTILCLRQVEYQAMDDTSLGRMPRRCPAN